MRGNLRFELSTVYQVILKISDDTNHIQKFSLCLISALAIFEYGPSRALVLKADTHLRLDRQY